MALGDYQSQETINQSTRGTTSRNLGTKPIQPTQYIIDRPYWQTHWWFIGIIVLVVGLIAVHALFINKDRFSKGFRQLYLAATLLLVMLMTGLTVYNFHAIRNIERKTESTKIPEDYSLELDSIQSTLSDINDKLDNLSQD